MAKKIPYMDLKECMACRICVSSCPFSCLEECKLGVDAYNKAYPELIHPETCTGCGICAKSCPVDAVVMS